MSGGDVVCAGWLRKSPPEKKLRRYAWRKRWFVLRSGRLSGDPDVLEYYKHAQSRKPLRSISLHLCEQVDAGLSFSKKELEGSFVFDLRTDQRVFYLVAESQSDMDRWVKSICELCGFNPTDERPSDSAPTSAATATGSTPVSTTTPAAAPPPYQPVGVRLLDSEDYLWLSHCESRRPPIGSYQSTSSDADNNESSSHWPPLSSSTSSSSSSSLANGLPPHPPLPPAHSSAPWASISQSQDAGRLLGQSQDAGRLLGQSQDSAAPAEPLRGVARCHPSPHPRKHSLDVHLIRPVTLGAADLGLLLLGGVANANASSAYQVPRPSQATPLSAPSSSGSSSSSSTPGCPGDTPPPSSAAPPPPPRPPKPPVGGAPGEGGVTAALPRPERGSAGGQGGGNAAGGKAPRGNTHTGVGSQECSAVPRFFSDRSTVFEFSESFNSYFVNKGLVPLEGACSEEEEADENYVAMTTADPPALGDVSPLQDPNYVSMTPCPGEPASLGRQVAPPTHLGFRSGPAPCAGHAPCTPPARRHTAGGAAQPPPVHRNLKPQRKVKPPPLDIPPLQEWEEVPAPVRSPVTRTFTRDLSRWPLSSRPSSNQSTASSSDSDDPDDNYVAMTTSSLALSGGESVRSGPGCSPVVRRPRGDKQVEYLDLDLHTGRQQRSVAVPGVCEERVDYVVVDPERTRALKNTREAWRNDH